LIFIVLDNQLSFLKVIEQLFKFIVGAKEEGYVLIGTGMGTSKKQFSTNDNLSELIKGVFIVN
jgi:hypothetical protein